jgi:ligand-binding SRPBCC domain-containing protein
MLISLTTLIHAPLERVFDLSRSIDLHQQSMMHTNEKAIAGKTSGLINENESVTWQAKHLGRTRTMKVFITKMQPYTFFEDIMIEGDFKSMKHRHYFQQEGNATIMKDEFAYELPYGIIGEIISVIFLHRYMKQLLQKRNFIIKEFAETDKWQTVLPIQ